MYYLVCVRKRVFLREDCVCASGSVVEHLLAKEGGRGFDPRLALFYFIRKSVFIWLPLFYLCKNDMAPPGTMSSLRLRSANNTLSLITSHKQPLYLILFLNCRHHRLLLIPHQQSLLFRLHMSQLYLM